VCCCERCWDSSGACSRNCARRRFRSCGRLRTDCVSVRKRLPSLQPVQHSTVQYGRVTGEKHHLKSDDRQFHHILSDWNGLYIRGNSRNGHIRRRQRYRFRREHCLLRFTSGQQLFQYCSERSVSGILERHANHNLEDITLGSQVNLMATMSIHADIYCTSVNASVQALGAFTVVPGTVGGVPPIILSSNLCNSLFQESQRETFTAFVGESVLVGGQCLCAEWPALGGGGRPTSIGIFHRFPHARRELRHGERTQLLFDSRTGNLGFAGIRDADPVLCRPPQAAVHFADGSSVSYSRCWCSVYLLRPMYLCARPILRLVLPQTETSGSSVNRRQVIPAPTINPTNVKPEPIKIGNSSGSLPCNKYAYRLDCRIPLPAQP